MSQKRHLRHQSWYLPLRCQSWHPKLLLRVKRLLCMSGHPPLLLLLQKRSRHLSTSGKRSFVPEGFYKNFRRANAQQTSFFPVWGRSKRKNTSRSFFRSMPPPPIWESYLPTSDFVWTKSAPPSERICSPEAK